MWRMCRQKEEADVYIDENEPDVVISLFTQGKRYRKLLMVLQQGDQSQSQGNIILYSDYANYYAEEGLSYRELC